MFAVPVWPGTMMTAVAGLWEMEKSGLGTVRVIEGAGTS